MRDSKSRPGRMVWSLISSAAACLASGAALAQAQVSTTSAVPMSYFVVQQPVDVCVDSPRRGIVTDCAYINNSLQTVLSSPTGVNTFVGFIDPATGMQSERNIWSAYGIDVRQTPVVQYNSTASLTLKVDSCSSGTSGCKSASFSTLAQQPAISTMTNPPAPPNIPTFPRNQTPTTINRYFVKNICSTTASTLPACTIGDVDGFGALNGNGFATQNRIFSPASTGKPDTDAHEKGHNLALDHLTFGAGARTNLLTAGSGASPRTSPTPTSPIGSKMNRWVLQVSPNASPPSSALDMLTPGSCSSLTNCDNQQGAALLSGFLNASPSASFTLFPQSEGDFSIQTAAASKPSNNPPPPVWAIRSGPLFFDGGDASACSDSDICNNAYLAEAVIVLTEGKFDNSSGHSFQTLYEYPGPVLAEQPNISHGNRGNEACESQGPTVWCLPLKFLEGAITLANSGSIAFTIGTKPLDINGLAGNVCYFWNTADGKPYYNSCADLASLFDGLGSDSQNVNLALNFFIPLDFPGTPGNKPCTTETDCPDPTNTYPID